MARYDRQKLSHVTQSLVSGKIVPDEEAWIVIVDRGSWIVDRGSWIVNRRSWIVSRGPWTVDRGS